MENTSNGTKNERKELLRVTDKYYLGQDQYNVIIYTRRVSKKGKVSFGDCKYHQSVEAAVNRIMELSEIGAVNADIKKMVCEIQAAKYELKDFVSQLNIPDL